MAWCRTPVMTAADDGTLASPEGSRVALVQMRLHRLTREALQAVAEDVEQGLLDTVGIRSRMVEGERAAMAIELPPEADPAFIAFALRMPIVTNAAAGANSSYSPQQELQCLTARASAT